jgi:SpoVK/Ycf46/Vps4 family AAA+-type ATPase
MTALEVSLLPASIIDRVDIIIELFAPSTEEKYNFLLNTFSKHCDDKLLQYIAERTVGHSFRDLPSFFKLIFRLGKGNITKDSIDRGLRIFKPRDLLFYDIEFPQISFDNLVGKELIKKRLKRIIDYKNDGKIKRHLLLLLYGLPGTGKTMMVRALANALNYPVIKISGKDIYSSSPLASINSLIYISARYSNSIILLDEFDKFIGKQIGEQAGAVEGQLNIALDEIKRKLKETVGNSMGWQSIETNLSKTELQNDFVQKVFDSFPPHIIKKIVAATETSNTLTHDSGEINLDTGELYSLLKNMSNCKLDKKELNKRSFVYGNKHLIIMLEAKELKKGKKLSKSLYSKYLKGNNEITLTLKKSTKDSQTVIVFDKPKKGTDSVHTKEQINSHVKETRKLINELGLARQINTHKKNIKKYVLEELNDKKTK